MSSYRAEQVGSLLRPRALLEARSAHVSLEALREAEDRAIAAALTRRLLEVGALVNGPVGVEGITPLKCAEMSGNDDVLRLLREVV